MWVTAAGNEVPLYVSCCCHWRENAVDDPDLEPARIRSL